MPCDQMKKLITDSLRNGTFDKAMLKEMEEHLLQCPECRSEREQEDRLFKLISENASEDVPDERLEDFGSRLRSRLRASASILGRLVPAFAAMMSRLILAFVPIFLPIFLLFLWLLVDRKQFQAYTHWLSYRPSLVGILILGISIWVVITACGKLTDWMQKKISSAWTDVRKPVITRLQVAPRCPRDEARLAHEIETCIRSKRLVRAVLWSIPTLICIAFGVEFSSLLFVSDDSGFSLVPQFVRYALGAFLVILSAYSGYAITQVIREARDDAKIRPRDPARGIALIRSLKKWRLKYLFNLFFAVMLACSGWEVYNSSVEVHSSRDICQAYQFAEQGKSDKAIQMLQQNMKYYPNQPSVLYAYILIGDIDAKEGRRVDSLQVYRDGIREYNRLSRRHFPPFDQNLVYSYAVDLYRRLGEKDKACAIINEHLKDSTVIDIRPPK